VAPGSQTKDDDLRVAFEKFGPVTYCKVMTDKETGRSRCARRRDAPSLVLSFGLSTAMLRLCLGPFSQGVCVCDLRQASERG
jgi:hypothetical protein